MCVCCLCRHWPPPDPRVWTDHKHFLYRPPSPSAPPPGTDDFVYAVVSCRCVFMASDGGRERAATSAESAAGFPFKASQSPPLPCTHGTCTTAMRSFTRSLVSHRVRMLPYKSINHNIQICTIYYSILSTLYEHVYSLAEAFTRLAFRTSLSGCVSHPYMQPFACISFILFSTFWEGLRVWVFMWWHRWISCSQLQHLQQHTAVHQTLACPTYNMHHTSRWQRMPPPASQSRTCMRVLHCIPVLSTNKFQIK